jgi:Phage protein (N4 Gp49/phage Sf6 gene 66) family
LIREDAVMYRELRNKVAKTEFTRMGQKTTICLLTLKSGFEIVGTSSCVDPRDFNEKIGNHEAEKAAYAELERYDGYLRHNNK